MTTNARIDQLLVQLGILNPDIDHGRTLVRELLTEQPTHRSAMAVAEAVREACGGPSLNLAAIVEAVQPAAASGAEEDLERVYDEFGIGAQARTIGILLGNISNAMRRAECLSAIEREFFMVPGEVDEDFPDQEPSDECLLNWGHGPADYVAAFREALRNIVVLPVSEQPESVNQLLLEALKLAHEMMVSNGLDLPHTQTVMMDAIAAAEAALPAVTAAEAQGIRTQFNACCNRDACRRLLDGAKPLSDAELGELIAGIADSNGFDVKDPDGVGELCRAVARAIEARHASAQQQGAPVADEFRTLYDTLDALDERAAEQPERIGTIRLLGQLRAEIQVAIQRLVLSRATASEVVDMTETGRRFMAYLPDGYSWTESPTEYVRDLIDQLHEAQPQGEPVAWRSRVIDPPQTSVNWQLSYRKPDDEGLEVQPLYTAPPAPACSVPDGWRYIESAPKDGRTILLGYFNALGNWRTLRGQWFTKEHIEENWEDADLFDGGWYETSVEADDVPSCWPTNPTHWMPTPAAPKPKGGA